MPLVNDPYKGLPPHIKRIRVISLAFSKSAHKRAIGKIALVRDSGKSLLFSEEVCGLCGKLFPASGLYEYIDLDDPDGNY